MREHTDQLYGAILSYEGKPAAYQIAYIDTLKRELDEVTKEFDQLLAQDLPALNDSLKSKGQQPLSPPPAKVGANGATHNSSGVTARAERCQPIFASPIKIHASQVPELARAHRCRAFQQIPSESR